MYPVLPSTWTPDAPLAGGSRPSRATASAGNAGNTADPQSPSYPSWRTTWNNAGWPASSSAAPPVVASGMPASVSTPSSSSLGVQRRSQSSYQLRQQYWHDAPYRPPPPTTPYRHVSLEQQQQQQQQQQHPHYQHYSPHYSHATFSHSRPPPRHSPPRAPASHESPPAPTRSRSLRSESDREEANRQKSKRHYDRKKVQRAALAELAAEYVQTVERLRTSDVTASRARAFHDVCEALALRLPNAYDDQQALASVDATNASDVHALNTVKRANERKRLNKLMQRQLEMQRIQQMSHISRALEAELRRRPALSTLIAGTASGSDHTRYHDWPVDADLRAAFYLLQPWLAFRSSWANLLLAEERLSLMTGRPIARIVTALRSLIGGGVAEARPGHSRQMSGTSAGTDNSSI